ncbi:hypothetical protein V8C40DRAFT_268286 [Trichoderma camerunense]
MSGSDVDAANPQKEAPAPPSSSGSGISIKKRKKDGLKPIITMEGPPSQRPADADAASGTGTGKASKSQDSTDMHEPVGCLTDLSNSTVTSLIITSQPAAPHCLCPLYDMAGSTVLVLPSPAFARVEPRGDPEAAEKTGQMGVDYFMCILAPGSMPSPSPILAPLCWSWNEALMEMISVRISGAAANVE